MASNYGRNFGFRRSDETMSRHEGRQRVPATGVFKQGMAVTFDAANPGYIKLAENGKPVVAGMTGLLVQEDAWDVVPGVQTDLSKVHNNRLCTIWFGSGVKVWFRNTGTDDLIDFTTVPAIGDFLGVSAPGKLGVVATNGQTQPQHALAVVTTTNGTDYLEAVLLK